MLEKLSLAGIARVLDVSETRLQQYVNKKYASVEQKQKAKVKDKKGG